MSKGIFANYIKKIHPVGIQIPSVERPTETAKRIDKLMAETAGIIKDSIPAAKEVKMVRAVGPFFNETNDFIYAALGEKTTVLLRGCLCHGALDIKIHLRRCDNPGMLNWNQAEYRFGSPGDGTKQPKPTHEDCFNIAQNFVDRDKEWYEEQKNQALNGTPVIIKGSLPSGAVFAQMSEDKLQAIKDDPTKINEVFGVDLVGKDPNTNQQVNESDIQAIKDDFASAFGDWNCIDPSNN